MSRAISRYLERHAEAALPSAPAGLRWAEALVIPAYREQPQLLDRMAALSSAAGPLLIILVLNRPQSDADPQANTLLREAISSLPPLTPASADPALYRLGEHVQLLLLDLERSHGPCPVKEGVGLARKSGCDLALAWHTSGALESPWICSTDADATLPDDYFQRLAGVSRDHAAICWPFLHQPSGRPRLDDACARYELRLHHYVLGLEYAGSPYAFHTLGSCISVHAENYAMVGGFPKRNAAEDFYLLNKLVKTGPIARLSGACVQLESRPSDRVPFGTGPAVSAIADSSDPPAAALYYHPDLFDALRVLLQLLPELYTDRGQAGDLMREAGCDLQLAKAAGEVLFELGLERALQHCRSHAGAEGDFCRHFHQWFDGFRTLKFIHGLRDKGWPNLSLDQLARVAHTCWPADASGDDPDRWLRVARHHWQWHADDPGRW